MNIGDLATWVGSFGSVGALIAAIMAVRYTKNLFRIELERDRIAEVARRVDEGERQKRQASSIGAWLTLKATPNSSQTAMLVVVLRNASELPVFKLDFIVNDRQGRQLLKEHLAVLPPNNQPVELPQIAQCDLENTLEPRALDEFSVEVSFIDATGLSWHREKTGVLVQIEDNTAKSKLKQFDSTQVAKQQSIDQKKASLTDTKSISK